LHGSNALDNGYRVPCVSLRACRCHTQCHAAAHHRSVPCAGCLPCRPMGWSSWYGFTQNINETMVKNMGAGMVSSGLAAVGCKHTHTHTQPACRFEGNTSDSRSADRRAHLAGRRLGGGSRPYDRPHPRRPAAISLWNASTCCVLAPVKIALCTKLMIREFVDYGCPYVFAGAGTSTLSS
jgi:hypothetical protein